jgi:hypothetical protein
MSDDLIERLRGQMCNRRNEQDCGCAMCDVLFEAAAEIRTLRAERDAAVQAEVAAIVTWLQVRAAHHLSVIEPKTSRLQPFCETCGKDVFEVLCPTCAKWWHDNAPTADRDRLADDLHEALWAADKRIAELEAALQATEAAIVYWLRFDLDEWPDYVAPPDIADAIERGEYKERIP